MSEPGARPAPGAAQQAAVPEGLVPAVVHLVNTGPVLLGAYTIAELTAVDAVVDFLEARPSDEVIADAVRSLAARQLLVPGPGDQVQVRGDLGIAVAFEQRARMVLDARVTGPGRASHGASCCSRSPRRSACSTASTLSGSTRSACISWTKPLTS